MVLRGVSCFRLVLLTAVVVFVSKSNSAEPAETAQVAIERGRIHLDQNQALEAEHDYRQIPWRSPLWSQKIHDYIRFYLSPKDGGGHFAPQEAWKLTQLSRRVRRTDIAQLKYFEGLSSYLAGSCPLEYSDSSTVFSELLWASTYRFADKFSKSVLSGGQSFSEMGDGIRTDSDVAGFTPYLSDLKTLRLVKGAGCRNYHYFLNPKRAPALELDHLMAAIRSPPTPQFTLQGADLWLIEIRAQMLAHQLGDRKAEYYVKWQTSRFSDEELTQLPPAERRIAFSERFSATDGTRYHKGQPEADVVLSILKNANLDEVDWLSLVDLDSFSAKERREILLPWRERDTDRAHPYLMLKLSEAEYQLGQIEPALQDLREGASHEEQAETAGEGEQTSPEQNQTEEFVSDLAERIFREYHFSAKVLGALRGTLSPHLWHSIEERLLYDYIVAGDVKSFDKIFEGFRSNDEKIRPVMLALVHRKLSTFKKEWEQIGKQNKYLAPGEMNFARNVAHAVFTLEANQRTGLLPFTSLVSQTLQNKMSAANTEMVEEQQLLIHQLAGHGAWEEGNSLVRSGVISVGRVQLDSNGHLDNPFHFQVPTNLPKTRLVLMPNGTSDREWTLQ